ncbi:Aromatic amino acid exporter YddG [Marinomonas spartinae]|uniref:Aromatic amino acid exporter YddG n=1 Tax=Marinomonas spartinae TaxID=1792290 RepID=A0A1A8TE00_9GAMM|nr:DMT family transporter [Marinomonas spartinae]SBS30260.1 Aromatic amino acid exporter YddG [Marinomonas spartinae]
MNKQATGIGFIAIFLWSSLALFTSQIGSVPPMLTIAITFSMASVFLTIVYFVRGELVQSWKDTPLKSMLLSGASYFFYHFFYFYALQHSPTLLAGILAYSWPLLIIMCLSSRKLSTFNWSHFIGGIIALMGTGLMIHSSTQMSTILDTTSNHNTSTSPTILGYFSAFIASLIWGSYSLANRRHSSVPSSCVLWNCIVAALFSVSFHLVLEPHVYNFSQDTWIAILGLGFGPIGVAFLCWDIGTKRGDLSLLGVLSYTAPALSILWTALFGEQTIVNEQIIAGAIVVIGVLIAFYRPTKRQLRDDHS